MKVKAVSALKADMPGVLHAIQLSHQPVLVGSNGKPQAILQDVASYQKTQDAIDLLKLMLHAEHSVAADRGFRPPPGLSVCGLASDGVLCVNVVF